MRWRAAAVCAALLACSAQAAAQTGTRPGPWVLDVRGVTSPLPEESAFYPPLHSTARLPKRGVGIDFGAHVYLFNLGAARLGVGANVFNIRARTKYPEPVTTGTSTPPPTSPPPPAGQNVQIDMRLIAPQLSFNFGTRSGWSYASAGIGSMETVSKTTEISPGRRETGRVNALNFGGGARWFLKSHLAFAFDVRMHRVSAGPGGTVEVQPPATGGSGSTTTTPPMPVPTPGKMILTVGAGFSFR